jgi:hypothetical protein
VPARGFLTWNLFKNIFVIPRPIASMTYPLIFDISKKLKIDGGYCTASTVLHSWAKFSIHTILIMSVAVLAEHNI